MMAARQCRNEASADLSRKVAVSRGRAFCRTPQSAKSLCFNKRRRGGTTVRCDCCSVGKPRRGVPDSVGKMS